MSQRFIVSELNFWKGLESFKGKGNPDGRTSQKFEILLRLEDSFHIHFRITDSNRIINVPHVLLICEGEVVWNGWLVVF